MPLVSIIVPVFNCELYLEKCLNSLVALTFKEFEVILVDDGSTDDSKNICDSFVKSDKRFNVIHKINEGVSIARNVGIMMAKGEWITFVDSDDWVEPCFLNILINHLQVDYVMTSYRKHNSSLPISEERFTEFYCGSLNHSFFIEDRMILGFFTPWAKFFRRTIIQNNKLKFNSNISSGEDTIFIYQYLLNVSSVYVSDIVCYNWIEANGLSNRKYSVDTIIYTVNQTIESFEKIENKFEFKLPIVKYNSIIYLINRIDIQNISIKTMYQSFKKLSKIDWMKNLRHDNFFVKKGRRRNLVDFMFEHELFMLLVVFCKLTNRFYE